MLALACSARFASADDSRSALEGVYSEAQAARGLAVYAEHCVTCHAEGMTGGPGSPPLAGRVFMIGWERETVGALYDYLKTTMPTGRAGALEDQQYADVLAAVLAANGFPSSADGGDLPPDPAALGGIMLGAAE